MRGIYTAIRAVARSTATVFITGEDGTGKRQCAQTIHALSALSEGPFVQFNCGAIPLDSIEREFFGQITDSSSKGRDINIGAAERANGGVLFLDDVCALDPKSQAKLVQLLQTSSVVPNGAVRPRQIHTRIICASSTPPLDAVNAGRFRADLYYRLHVIPIALPPLRDRGLDIIEISDGMIARFAAKEKRLPCILSPEVKKILLSYPWPGNVRELINLIWSIIVVKEGQLITPADLPSDFQGTERSKGRLGHTLHEGSSAGPLDTMAKMRAFEGMTLADIEHDVVDLAILKANGSIPQAARALGVSPSTLYRKLETWGHPARRSKPR